MGSPDLQLVGKKDRSKPGACDWHLKWGQSFRAESLTCVIRSYLQVDSVRIKL